MNRRVLLAGASTFAASCAFAQPRPLIGPVGGQHLGGGPLFSLGSGPPGKTLDLSFMQPGTLDPRLTFARAGTATYFDSTGTMQTAATNASRWDYNPGTLALNGLLIEEARTNSVPNSTSLTSWAVIRTTLTGSSGVAPDGTALLPGLQVLRVRL